jgi:hypothetical protein
MRNVGGSALLGSAIGAVAGYSRNRSVLNSALEGAVAGAVGGALYSSSTPLPPRLPPPTSSSSRRYLNIYNAHHLHDPSSLASLGFSYRIGGGGSSRGNNEQIDEMMRMMLTHGALRSRHVTGQHHTDNIDNMSYERLLEVFGDGSENRGASSTQISRLPTCIIQNIKDLPLDCRKCSICLEMFESGETRKTLECLHGFHDGCIDKWLMSNASCPICKFRVTG